MSLQTVILPVLAQVVLVFVLGLVVMGRTLYDVAKKRPAKQAQPAASAFSNQFEVPVLFFALVPLAIITRKADLLFVAMSWAFVLSRVAHVAVYVTSNRTSHRFAAFLVGVLVLLAMWIIFAIRIISSPLPA